MNMYVPDKLLNPLVAWEPHIVRSDHTAASLYQLDALSHQSIKRKKLTYSQID